MPVVLSLWRVPRRGVPRALAQVVGDRRRLHRLPGPQFARLLGVSTGFRPREADLRRWALVASWPDGTQFAAPELVERWDQRASESWRVTLRPLRCRGRWSGRSPFGPAAHPPEPTGAVAVLTRARLHPVRARRFRRAVPAVAAELADRPGLALALGMGEWPVGRAGTFSLWRTADALRGFAGAAAHRRAVQRTVAEGWYAEELFARFAVLASSGTVDGRSPL